jgi:hypothetical protein
VQKHCVFSDLGNKTPQILHVFFAISIQNQRFFKIICIFLLICSVVSYWLTVAGWLPGWAGLGWAGLGKGACTTFSKVVHAPMPSPAKPSPAQPSQASPTSPAHVKTMCFLLASGQNHAKTLCFQ